MEAVINPVTYKMTLSTQFRVHPVFHRSLLEPAAPASPHQPTALPPAPILVQGQPEYEVAHIVDSYCRWGRLQYLVDWKGYSPEDMSWEEAEAVHTPQLVWQFHLRYSQKHGPGGQTMLLRIV